MDSGRRKEDPNIGRWGNKTKIMEKKLKSLRELKKTNNNPELIFTAE